MSPDRKLVLLAVDGSDQSFEMVKYVANAFNMKGTEVVLFHIMDKVPDIFWDWEKDPLASKHLEHMKQWDTHKQTKIQEFMTKATNVLKKAGAAEGAVTVNIQKRKEGIARDILKESQYGYTVLAFGRNGVGAYDDAMLGSVASKLLINLTDVSICLVGGKPKPGKVLAGVDNSLGSLRVINFIGKYRAVENPIVTLAHVIRVPRGDDGNALDDSYVKQLVKKEQEAMKPVLEDAVKSLVAAGVGADRISTKFITEVGSRAVALFEEAKKGKYGAICIGKRGMTEVEEFHMGRVATKLTQIARNMAVWIVS